MSRIVLLLVLVSAFVTRASAQAVVYTPLPTSSDTASTPQRDSQAETTLQAAITALGGTAAIGQAQSWKIQAQAQGNAVQNSGPVSYEVTASDFRIDFSTAAGSTVILTGHGKPAYVNQAGSVLSLPAYYTGAMINPVLIGTQLLQELQDSNRSLIYLGVREIENNNTATVVATALPATPSSPAVTHTWYFDKTNVPIRMEYRMPLMGIPQATVPVSLELSNYLPVGGVLYPNSVTYRQQGRTISLTVQSVSINPTIASSDFDLPTGGAQ